MAVKLAYDSQVIHLAGVETVTGAKTFNATPTLAQGVSLVAAANTNGKLLNFGGNAYTGSSTTSCIVTTNGNLHIDAAATGSAGQAIYLNYYGGTQGVAFGAGNSSSAVAWMGPDGDLWKGSADNTGNQYYHTGNDTGLVHVAGVETITGAKTFSGLLTNTSGRLKNISVKTVNYTIVSTDHIIVANNSSSFTLTLPAASSNTSREYIIKNKGSAAVTVDATGAGLIDGANSTTVPQYSAVTLISDGSTWNAF